MPEIDALLSKVGESARALNLQFESFNELVSKIESQLDENHVGVEASVPFEEFIVKPAWLDMHLHVDAYDEPVTQVNSLSYMKWDGKWQLVVEEVMFRNRGEENEEVLITDERLETEAVEVRALGQCSRDVRMNAVGKIPELLCKIDAALQERLAEVRQSVKEATQMIE